MDALPVLGMNLILSLAIARSRGGDLAYDEAKN